MGSVIFYITLVLAIAGFSFFIYKIVKFCKEHVIGVENPKIDEQTKLMFTILTIIQGILCIALSFGLVIKCGWTLKVFEVFLIIIGSFVFGSSLNILVGSFALYYYKPELDKIQRKNCRTSMFIIIPFVIAGLILLTSGYAKYATEFSLPNGFSLEGLTYPDDLVGGFSVKFYGICIVVGACITYAICDHYFFNKFNEHGILESCFVVAFLGGIIGARLWFCFVLEPEYFLSNPSQIIRINEGGLAIQGGAILGIITGVSYMLIFRKNVDIRFAMDVIVPAILIAQVVGRWGNFFNQEVYGKAVSESSLWWVPSIIKYNMYIEGEYRLPLFLIEGCLNLFGYFFIRYFLGKLCKFHLGLGYQASFYLIWYGAVRVILEPLRDGFILNGSHVDGFGYMQSWIVAFSMIGIGIFMFLIFYYVHHLRVKKHLEN